MFTCETANLLEDLDPMIELIRIDGLPVESFRALFNQQEGKCSFNVTSNQFKRIKHYLQTLSTNKQELWNNKLFTALSMDKWTDCSTDNNDSADYLAEVQSFYKTSVYIAHSQAKGIAPEVTNLFETPVNYVIAEYHGTIAPISLLRLNIEQLTKIKAAISIEGLSLEEIEEINQCNSQNTCSLLLYMLVPVEKNINLKSQMIALEKRQLVLSLISAGIKIIPGDNKFSINLPACKERLRLCNYSAIQNARAANHDGPVIFWVGKAHAVKTEGCPGIASLTGAKLIDLTGEETLISEPLSKLTNSYLSINTIFACKPSPIDFLASDLESLGLDHY